MPPMSVISHAFGSIAPCIVKKANDICAGDLPKQVDSPHLPLLLYDAFDQLKRDKGRGLFFLQSVG